jgi:hypothetical protein
MALSMMQEMSIHDANGNCRCPYCGKYRKRSDFDDQPGNIPFGGGVNGTGHIHVAAMCRYCWDEGEEQCE